MQKVVVSWFLRRLVAAVPLSVASLLLCASSVDAQQIVDRVLARVGTSPVKMTDVQAAIGLGLIEIRPGEDRESAALDRTIERQLILAEVARFPPTEPTPAAVDEEVAAMRAHAGAGYAALARATGLDDERLKQLARETLRIRAYVAQRFGTTAQVTDDEVRAYYDAHPSEFTREGTRLSFEDAEADARRRASAERLNETINRWIADLRMRAEVVIIHRP